MQLIGCISTRSPTDSFRGGHEAYENRRQRSSRNRECGARGWERELLTIASQKARVGTALATTVGLAAAAWVITVRQMHGMDMGVATQLGSFAFFVALWAVMMTAMMLPGLVPAVLRRTHSSGPVRAVVPFVASYLVVWTLVGALLYALYRPHGTITAGLVVIAAGLYELTRLKQHCRRCCRARTRSGGGLEFGLYCVGSSIGLMVMLVALGVT